MGPIRIMVVLLLSILGIVSSIPTFADSSEIIMIGSDPQKFIQLDGVQDHDIFENVYVEKTCSRQVLSHYDEYCYNVPAEVCHTDTDGVRTCTSTTRRECSSSPVYETEFYDCSYWEEVWVGKEIDYYISASINLKYEMPEGIVANDQIKVRIDNDTGWIRFIPYSTSKKYLIFVDQKLDTTVVASQKKEINGEVTIRLVPILDIRAAFDSGIALTSFDENRLSFQIKDHIFADQMDFELKLNRQRTLWFSKKIVSGLVNDTSIEFTREAGMARYAIDLQSLTLREPLKKGKKYKIVLKAGLSHKAIQNCINLSDLGQNKVELKLKKQKF